MTKETMRKKGRKKSLSRDRVVRLRALLDPESIVHDDAKSGSEFLLTLPDKALATLFQDVTVERIPPGDLAKAFLASNKSAVQESALQAALRRLSMVGIPLARELSEDRKDEPERPIVTMKLSPGATLKEHLAKASQADKKMDGVEKMASLAVLLEQQLANLYGHQSREANPFLLIGQVNQSASILMNALEKLHRMQVDVGIIQKQPDKLEVDLLAAGAFQTYLGELDNGAREQMITFSGRFSQFVQEKCVTQNAD